MYIHVIHVYMLSGGNYTFTCYQVGTIHLHVIRWELYMYMLSGGNYTCTCYQVGTIHVPVIRWELYMYMLSGGNRRGVFWSTLSTIHMLIKIFLY